MDNTEIRILVVDDDDMLRDMHSVILEDEDYQVDSAENGREALDFFATHQYDLLLTDMFMPEMNGIELIIQCQQHYPLTKIIMLSGGGKEIEAKHGAGTIRFKSQEVEIELFLQKPFDLDEMLSLIEKILQK
ncbi:hypothetical protein MNBD_GAMMA23-1169 [hydrothermal vent metagenome]|uniref:Response regulatory domain-containing protein n=1 Tax=hydrothermal vent metagenome TaxID=652676 RepID=A0A3B1A587_9ZZZZ